MHTPHAWKGYGARRASISLPAYLATLVAYSGLLGAHLWRESARPQGRGSTPRKEQKEDEIKDFLLIGAATHKLSRTLTKDAVTAPLRATFTRYQEPLGYGELQEEPRRPGLAGAVGDLLSCNYCADPWIALALTFGWRRFPHVTRPLVRLFCSIATADFMHVVYETVRTRENVLTLHEERLENRKSA